MNEWPTIELGQLAEFRNGLNYSAADNGVGLAVVGVSDFQDKSFVDFSSLTELDQSALSTSDALIRKNDILFVRSNGNRELIGRSLLVLADPPKPTSHSGFTIRLRFTDKRADPRFFAYFLRGGMIRRHLSSQGGGTNINNLNQGILSRLTVPLPPLETQRRIASILAAYDDLIEVNRRRIAVLEEMARGLFEEWFVRFRFPGHEQIAMTESKPNDWRLVKVGAVLRKFRRPVKVMKQEYEQSGIIPCIDQGADFIGGYTNNTDALITSPLPLCVFGDHTRVLKFITFPFASGADGTQLLYPVDDLTPEFLYFSLLNVDLSNQHYARHFKFLKEQEIWLPARELIERFTMVVKPQMELVENIRFQNQKLAASRDLLLPRLISGQLSVAAERELEEAA